MSSLKQALRQVTADKMIALTILVSALGYFVDVFDILLFVIVRIQSMKDLGLPEADLLSAGVKLLNMQLWGLLLGGVVFGIAGDKFGRVSVLFASIILYSVANIANGFITNLGQYAALRFIAGFGLAGELGIGVTLVSELLPKNIRGLGTTFVAVIGLLGAIAASAVTSLVDWRTAYIVGGIIGLLLLALRVGVRESGLYKKMDTAKKGPSRGNPLILFKKPVLLMKYVSIVMVGAPVMLIIGVFITFTPEFAKAFGMTVMPNVGKAVLFCYTGLAVGNFFSGIWSQSLASRRKPIGIFLCFLIVSVSVFLTVHVDSLPVYYLFCGILGLNIGYWILFVQAGAEQFGTNLRATVATSIPNFVRGLAIPMTISFKMLIPSIGVVYSGAVVAAAVIFLAFIALWHMEETFHADLDYLD